MPHVVLTLSQNVKESSQIQPFFEICHNSLVSMLPTELDSCKSRLFICDTYRVGSGREKNAFVHIEVKVMPGRSQTILKSLAEKLLDEAKRYFTESFKTLDLQVTIEIIELQNNYLKAIS